MAGLCLKLKNFTNLERPAGIIENKPVCRFRGLEITVIGNLLVLMHSNRLEVSDSRYNLTWLSQLQTHGHMVLCCIHFLCWYYIIYTIDMINNIKISSVTIMYS